MLEKNGTEHFLGTPVAFIETAWRRYTKHARNKAQEIQGAVLPLARRYDRSKPFLGAILAGEFTEGSLAQLRSSGFAVAYIPTAEIVGAFGKHGIDLSWEENTPDERFEEQVGRFEGLDSEARARLVDEVQRVGAAKLAQFFETLNASIVRKIGTITIVALHGSPQIFDSVAAAIDSIRSRKLDPALLPFQRFEIVVRYGNGDKVTAEFAEVKVALEFHESLRPAA